MVHPDIITDDGQSVFHLSSCCYSLPSCHIHNHNELLFLISGRLRLENNLDIIEVDAPAVILHNSYTMHRAELLEGQYERYIINFDDRTLETIRPMQNTISFFKSANMTVIRLTNDMKTVLENYIARYMILNEEDDSRNTLICLILYEISKYRSEENSVKMRASISYINNVMQYISMHYSKSITLADLAAQFYISRAKLASDFSTSVGMTVKQYTTLVRMNVARGMILNGKSAAETALACGYNNTGNFIATFTKYFGDSPVRYRNAVSEKAT